MDYHNYHIWTNFFEELADNLYAYRKNRPELILKIKAIYKKIRMTLPTLDSDGNLVDVDPFTVYGLFNKGLTNENRIKILKGFAEEFAIQSEVPIDFIGIPVLNNMQATFYRFQGKRGEQDIDHLWDIFCAALDYAQDTSAANRTSFITAYDLVMQQKGIRWNLSMGLYWVRPYQFINLDSRNRWFMLRKDKMPQSFAASLDDFRAVPSGSAYLDMIDHLQDILSGSDYPYHNFPELSVQAWELSESVNRGDLPVPPLWSSISDGIGDQDVATVHYWLYSPGAEACCWDEFYAKGIMAIGWGEIGDLTAYDSKESMREAMKEFIDPSRSYMHSSYATWQFANEMKPGDIVFAKRGKHIIIGKGTVSSEYRYDDNRPDEYKHIRDIHWDARVELEHPGHAAVKTLTDITAYTEYVNKLLQLFDEPETPPVQPHKLTPYSRENFLSEVYIDESTYNTLTGLLKYKQNIILQGAPGVGKTYAAKRLAYAYMGVKNPEQVMMVQFHQSYSYEDFIMGFRPTESGGFAPKPGPFYNFCKKAEMDNENPYFFIIDEINRGNLSKIFGELFMLLERDKRNIPLRLLYADETFSVPQNVYIIGTMNTSDRSLAMLDFALRRRFAFFELKPAFQSAGFRSYQAEKGSAPFNRLIATVEQLNQAITDDETLGRGFCIGHSYFCTDSLIDASWLQCIVRYELIPLLEEYWFDEPEKVRQWSSRLLEAIQ